MSERFELRANRVHRAGISALRCVSIRAGKEHLKSSPRVSSRLCISREAARNNELALRGCFPAAKGLAGYYSRTRHFFLRASFFVGTTRSISTTGFHFSGFFCFVAHFMPLLSQSERHTS